MQNNIKSLDKLNKDIVTIKDTSDSGLTSQQQQVISKSPDSYWNKPHDAEIVKLDKK